MNSTCLSNFLLLNSLVPWKTCEVANLRWDPWGWRVVSAETCQHLVRKTLEPPNVANITYLELIFEILSLCVLISRSMTGARGIMLLGSSLARRGRGFATCGFWLGHCSCENNRLRVVLEIWLRDFVTVFKQQWARIGATVLYGFAVSPHDGNLTYLCAVDGVIAGGFTSWAAEWLDFSSKVKFPGVVD